MPTDELTLQPRHHAQSEPDRLAIIRPATGEQMTFAELEAASTRVARVLDGLGIGPGDHVAVLLANSIMRELGRQPFGTGTAFEALTGGLFGFGAPMTYLCPAPSTTQHHLDGA